MKKLLLILIALVFLSGLIMFLKKGPGGANQSQQTEVNSKVNSVSPAEFADLAKDSRAFMVDVHTPEQTHIPGTDAFIPFDRIEENQDKLPQDKTTPILVYCRSGSMSSQAAGKLVDLGYEQIYDLEGGTDVYKEQQVSVAIYPDNRDLGEVIYGETANTSFTVTNYTPLPLKITRVSTSCGCTKAQAAKEELAAYESTEIAVTFDPAVHKDDTDLGDLTRTIYIETDNPNFSSLESTITATVVKN